MSDYKMQYIILKKINLDHFLIFIFRMSKIIHIPEIVSTCQ